MGRLEKQRRKRGAGRRRILKGVLAAVLLLIVGVSAYGIFIGVEAYQTWNQMQVSDDSDGKGSEQEEKSLKEPFTMLILGLDTRDGDLGGLPDVIMLAVVDPKEKDIFLTSIPRDTYVMVPGYNQYDKINHTYGGKYPNGGIRLLQQTLEEYLQVPIDYYLKVNFDGFTLFIDDVLGGLDLHVERPLYHHRRGHLVVSEGFQTVNGEQALYYVRHRADSEGDFGRIRRQHQVIREILNQSMNLRTVTRINQILNVIGENVRFNMPFSQVMQLVRSFSSVDGSQLETTTLTGTPAMHNGVSYVFVDEEERQRVSQLLQQQLFNNHANWVDSDHSDKNSQKYFDQTKPRDDDSH